MILQPFFLSEEYILGGEISLFLFFLNQSKLVGLLLFDLIKLNIFVCYLVFCHLKCSNDSVRLSRLVDSLCYLFTNPTKLFFSGLVINKTVLSAFLLLLLASTQKRTKVYYFLSSIFWE